MEHVLSKIYTIKYTKETYSFNNTHVCNNKSVIFTKLLIYIPAQRVSLDKKPGDFQWANFENYQTFDPGRVLHYYFDIINIFNFTDDVHSLFFFVALKYMAFRAGALGKRLQSHMVSENMRICQFKSH